MKRFQNYIRYSTHDFKDKIICYLNNIEKGINARSPLEEVLRIKESVVKERRENEKHMIEIEIMRLEKMIQKGKCNSPWDDMDAKRAKQSKKKYLIHFRLLHTLLSSGGFHKRAHDNRVHERTMQTHEGMINKDASKIDNNVAGASHDKDNITKAFKQDEDKYVNNIIQLEAKNKDLENIVCKMGKSSQTLRMLTNEQSLYREIKWKKGLGYTDPCPLSQAIASHPKLYDAEVLSYQCVKPDVHDTEEILNDAEESQIKMKEKQFQFNYENINSLYDTFVP
ncbi:hypothetical protein Tco_0741713 [Tanacetum coccineum]